MANGRNPKAGRASPLDVPDRVYGRNPHALSAAARRSSERTDTPVARARPAAHAAAHPSALATKKRTAVARTEAAGRKGGPGKRRATPKKSGRQRG